MVIDISIRRTKWLYAIALSFVALCLIVSSFLMQRAMEDNGDDARLINLSGRQRMLSQKIAKTALALSLMPEDDERIRRSKELREALSTWLLADRGLRFGDPSLGLRKRQLSSSIAAKFQQIDPHRDGIAQVAESLLARAASPSGEKLSLMPQIKQLLDHEAQFLTLMEEITLAFEQEAKAKIEALENLERVFLLLGISVLVLEYFLVFRPSVRRMENMLGHLQAAETEHQVYAGTLSKMLEESIELADRANQAKEAKAAFLASVSHELRTPLNGIAGMAELLNMTDLSDEQAEYVHSIKACSNDLSKLIDSVIDYSQIDQQQVQCDLIEFPLRQTIRSALGPAQSLAESKQVHLVVSVEPMVPDVIQGDQQKVARILEVLSENAAKFTDEGQIVIGVAIISRLDNEVVLRFSVSDTGIGITDEQRKHLFQPFVQGDDSFVRQYSGTGIGLATFKRLVELMGGRMGFDSMPGSGSTFWFETRFMLPDY